MTTRSLQLNRSMWCGGCGVAIVSLIVLFGADGREAAQSKSKVGVEDVAWIAGNWVTEKDGNELEEVWSSPRGDCMMGMFRWLKEGQVWIYELLTIREEAESLVLRFRHFGNDLTAWEPKAEPLTYRVHSLTPERAVFENPASESHRRYTFERDGPDTLIVRVGAFRDGSLHEDEFRYRRK